MPEKSFLEEVSEIITPALDRFKKQSPEKQQKYLTWLGKVADEEKRELEKDITLRVRKLFADNAKNTEVQDDRN